MSAKRKYLVGEDGNTQDVSLSNKKHTLDSDEEDSDDYEKRDLGDSDIEGEEDGVSKIQDEVKITPFNMREELEEGHFDTEGYYHWNKTNDVKDNWLDNIDWMKIEKKTVEDKKDGDYDNSVNGLNAMNELSLYKQMLLYMNEGETVADALRRLGKKKVKLSSAERLKLKKQGIVFCNGDNITKLTELANNILIKTGNMDVYQLSYEFIKEKVNSVPCTSKEIAYQPKCDMYSDNFSELEKTQLLKTKNEHKLINEMINEILWEFKWNERDTVLQGPFDSKQMLKWSKEGYFKSGVYVRKVGELTNFYSSSRIDFDIYV